MPAGRYTFRLLRQPYLTVGDDIQMYLTWAVNGLPLRLHTWEGWEEVSPIEPIAASSHLNLTAEAAQILMDDLWSCGIRPTEGVGSAGQLAAVQNHIADLRTANDRSHELLRRLVDVAAHPPIVSTLEVRNEK